MGKRTRYEPGTFCWTDPATAGPEGTKAFYGGLLGWEAEDMPAGESSIYTMLRLEGDYVAGLYEMGAEQREQGASPYWFSYVSVESADAVAERARELGGTVYGEAFDVLDSGRMAVVEDPTGAMLAAWEPRAHIGAGRVNDPGCMTWNELQSGDPETAAAFYSGLFGWKTQPMEEDGKLVYVTISNAGSMNGGIMPTHQQDGVPPYWLPYFTVPSSEEAIARAQKLGGEVCVGPLDIGAGRISVLRDPQGATFAIYEGETDD